MADEAGAAEFSQRADMFADRIQAGLAKVDHIEVVAAELAQVSST
jgi:hypothetical protein